MSPDKPSESFEMNVDRAIAELQLAFSNSETKGTVFWAVLLLPDSEINTELNVKAANKLQGIFANSQNKLVENTLRNLRYLRDECLADSDVKLKIEKAKADAIEQSAASVAMNRLRRRASEGAGRRI